MLGNSFSRIFLIRAMVVTIVAICITMLWLVGMIADSRESVRLRNSIIASVGAFPQDFTWEPGQVPADFLQENSPIPEGFKKIAASVLGNVPNQISEFDKARLIAVHLVQAQQRRGGYIMADTAKTYQLIVNDGRGYCADFTEVFNGIAYAAGIPVRKWGLAFDGFGAGHAFNEIYDRSLHKWVFIDSFNSMFVEDSATGAPLSVLEFQSLLRTGNGTDGYRIVPIVASKFGFHSVDVAADYYRRGADQFYLWWGNNVFQYDNHILVRIASLLGDGLLGRSMEQTLAIAAGVFPRIRMIKTDTNGPYVNTLLTKRTTFLVGTGFLVALITLLILEVRVIQRRRNKKIIVPNSDVNIS